MSMLNIVANEFIAMKKSQLAKEQGQGESRSERFFEFEREMSEILSVRE